jgi:hypothetical protein
MSLTMEDGDWLLSYGNDTDRNAIDMYPREMLDVCGPLSLLFGRFVLCRYSASRIHFKSGMQIFLSFYEFQFNTI